MRVDFRKEQSLSDEIKNKRSCLVRHKIQPMSDDKLKLADVLGEIKIAEI